MGKSNIWKWTKNWKLCTFVIGNFKTKSTWWLTSCYAVIDRLVICIKNLTSRNILKNLLLLSAYLWKWQPHYEITTLAISKLEKGGKSKQLIVLNRLSLNGTNKGGKGKITDFGEIWMGCLTHEWGSPWQIFLTSGHPNGCEITT